MPNDLWTPAEVSAILFNCFGEPAAAIEYLAKNKPREIGEAIEDPIPIKKTEAPVKKAESKKSLPAA